jgi:hypothetical protein
MAVRKTETRIPAGLSATDLGEAVVASDGRCALVAFATSPVTASRQSRYVAFVTDAGLASQVDSYQWSFVENGGAAAVQTTPIGEAAYAPTEAGSLEVGVKLLDAGSTELASLTLNQDIGNLNPILEGAIADAADQPGPGAANPDVLRELVNDYSPYYQAVTLKTPETDDSFLHFLFSIVFDGSQQRSQDQRGQRLDELAAAMNDQGGDVATLIASGSGACGLRIPLLAMTDGVSGPGSTAKRPCPAGLGRTTTMPDSRGTGRNCSDRFLQHSALSQDEYNSLWARH